MHPDVTVVPVQDRFADRDPLFFYEGGKYVELTADLYKGIIEGTVRL